MHCEELPHGQHRRRRGPPVNTVGSAAGQLPITKMLIDVPYDEKAGRRSGESLQAEMLCSRARRRNEELRLRHFEITFVREQSSKRGAPP